MGDTILFRRGTAANLPDLQEGEPGWTTDTETLFIGTDVGTAAAAKKIGGGNTIKVSPLDYARNTTPGTTDMTAAIDLAIATGYDVEIDGIMGTTGLHRLSTTGQKIYGVNEGTLKRLSGTSYILDTTHGVARAEINDLKFDGNSLGGEAIIWRAHYSKIDNITVTGIAGTSYGIRISGVNVSSFSNLTVSGYGGILLDQTGDTGVTPTPSYGCLYSTFKGLILVATGGSALKLAGSQVQAIVFEDLYVENNFGTPSQAFPMISIAGGGPITSIHFKNLNSEYGQLGAELVRISNAGAGSLIGDIHFDGGRITSEVDVTHGFPLFIIAGDTGAGTSNVSNISVKNMMFLQSVAKAAFTYFYLAYATNVVFENNIFFAYPANDFVFISDFIGNSYITDRNNGPSSDGTNWPGKGANTWTSATNVVIESNPFTQDGLTTLASYNLVGLSIGTAYTARHTQAMGSRIAISDEGEYDIWGDGGVSNAGDFSGMVFMVGSTQAGEAATDIANIAQFYAQATSAAGTQQLVSMTSGANIELVEMANGTAAALASSTDGKLSVQVGYAGGGAKRFLRVYNRLGYAITLRVHVLRF